MRLFRSVFLLSCAVALVGCYSLQRTSSTALVPGERVAFDVTDAGRVALGGSMGPEIDQVEGRLIQRDNGDYLLGVTSVKLLRGGYQTWAGEQVRIKPEFVGSAYQRKLNVGNTLIVTAIGVGAVAAIASQQLIANGVHEQKEPPLDTAVTVRRPPRGVRFTLLSVDISRIPFIGRR